MGNRRVIINKEELIRLYCDENKSAAELAKHFDCSVMAIIRRLKLFEIPVRGISEAKKGHKLSPENRLKVIKNLKYGQTGADNHMWKGGRSYAGRKNSPYPTIRINGVYIKEHRYVMEQHLGGRKLLPSEHVHHLNGDKFDNRVENLQVMSASDHAKIHMTPEYRKYLSEYMMGYREKNNWSTKKKEQ